MQPRDHGHEARALALRIGKASIWLAGFATAGLILAPAAALGWGTGKLVAPLCLALAMAGGLLALGLSGVLRLNAALFQLMASHGDEISGGMQADDFLARAGLQAEPAVIRRLADRAAGVRRLQTVQRGALAVFVLMTALSFAALNLR